MGLTTERREGANQNRPAGRAGGGAGGGREREETAPGPATRRRERGSERLVYENICLGRGQLEMHLGRFFTTWNLFQQIDLLLCIVFCYQKKS